MVEVEGFALLENGRGRRGNILVHAQVVMKERVLGGTEGAVQQRLR